MRKLLVGLFIFFIGVVNIYALDIESIRIKEKSDTINVTNPTIDGLNIDSDIKFNKVGDFVTFEILLNDKDNDDYKISKITDNNTNENIKTSYDYDGLKVYLTLKYERELEDFLKLNDIEISIELEDGVLLINPKTFDSKTFVTLFLIILSLIAVILLLKLKQKQIGALVILILLMPMILVAKMVFKAQIVLKTTSLVAASEKVNYKLYDYEIENGEVTITKFAENIARIADYKMNDIDTCINYFEEELHSKPEEAETLCSGESYNYYSLSDYLYYANPSDYHLVGVSDVKIKSYLYDNSYTLIDEETCKTNLPVLWGCDNDENCIADAVSYCTIDNPNMKMMIAYLNEEDYETIGLSDVVVKKYEVYVPTDIVIPSTFENYPVTKIGAGAFSSSNLSSVVIPNTVRVIENMAFGDNHITSIDIPNSVTTIGYGAFESNNITSLVIPDSVESIGDWSFAQNDLSSIVALNPNLSFGRNLFGNNRASTLFVDIVNIPNYIFSGNGESTCCYNKGTLSELTLGSHVQKIGFMSFKCNNITSLTIPNNVTSIGSGAFEDNPITNVSIDMTEVQANIFNTTNSSSIIYTGAACVNPPTKITSVSLGDNVKVIKSGAFSDNEISQVNLPNGLTTINGAVFENNKITSIVIPNTVTKIDSWAFYGNLISTVTIPSSVDYLGARAFQGNPLTSVIIKGKTSSSEFSTYNRSPGVWSWDPDVTCVKNNIENVENGCITWGE